MVVVRPMVGGSPLPPKLGKSHTAYVGQTGSGKSVSILEHMRSTLPAIAEGGDQRALVYDAKQDILSHLYSMVPGTPVRVLNPLDRRASRWDIAADITSVVSAQQMGDILVEEEENSNNPFFRDACWQLVTGILVALHYIAPGKWRFRHVLLIARRPALMIELFSRCPYTDDLVVYFKSDSREFSSIMTTMATKLARFEPIAALMEHAKDNFSIRQFLKSNEIAVLGNDDSCRVALDALNRALIARFSQLALAQSENELRNLWIYVDECREAGRLKIGPLLTKGRSKGVTVVLGFQDIEGLREVYGPHVANEILGQCGIKVVLRVSSPETASWAAALCGSYLSWEESYAESEDQPLFGRREGTISHGLQERAAGYTSDFLTLALPDPQRGVEAIYFTPDGFYRHVHNPFPSLPKRDPLVRDYWPHEEEAQYLQPWGPEDNREIFGENSDVLKTL